ncbi:MAG: right-handed parallel beta-helix repeat-containing protein [Candidatus Helarchaeota archaeon]|nr:right-handed parallel beta-helix repeat-containing protein [Candidatus Helarchaeota archaeon]
MKCSRKVIALLLLISFLMVSVSTLLISMPQPLKADSPNTRIVVNQDPYAQPSADTINLSNAPLGIDRDAQVATTAFEDNGSKEHPSIVQVRLLNASELELDADQIQNRSAYLRLQNCTISNIDPSYAGFLVINVTNACPDHNTAQNNGGDGIELGASYDNTLINNTIHDNELDGVDLEASQDNALTGNTAYNNRFDEFGSDSSHDNALIDNTIHQVK